MALARILAFLLRMIFKKKLDPLQIIAFQTYGTNRHFYAKGRALEDENIDLSNKGFWKLLINTWKRFETDEVGDSPIDIHLPNGKVIKARTDSEGYYLADEELEDLEEYANEEGWLPYEVTYDTSGVDPTRIRENRFPGEILIPPATAEFGVISDIDDTILHTGVVSSLKWQVIFNTVFKRPEKRTPLDGAAQFYHLLHRGKTGEGSNPIFYVSHSPWNLYRYLELFLKEHNFPKGPILLRSFKSFLNRKKVVEKPQKQKEILNILETYPNLNFILIGDSGEHDADIYIEIAEAYPDRILAIYLRSVKHRKRMMRVKGLFKSYETVPVLLAEDSKQLFSHAFEKGFIADPGH